MSSLNGPDCQNDEHSQILLELEVGLEMVDFADRSGEEELMVQEFVVKCKVVD